MIGLALAVALAVSQAAGASGPKIAAVRIHGNHTTPDAEVLTLAAVSPGDPATPDVESSVGERLERSGRFPMWRSGGGSRRSTRTATSSW